MFIEYRSYFGPDLMQSLLDIILNSCEVGLNFEFTFILQNFFGYFNQLLLAVPVLAFQALFDLPEETFNRIVDKRLRWQVEDLKGISHCFVQTDQLHLMYACVLNYQDLSFIALVLCCEFFHDLLQRVSEGCFVERLVKNAPAYSSSPRDRTQNGNIRVSALWYDCHILFVFFNPAVLTFKEKVDFRLVQKDQLCSTLYKRKIKLTVLVPSLYYNLLGQVTPRYIFLQIRNSLVAVVTLLQHACHVAASQILLVELTSRLCQLVVDDLSDFVAGEQSVLRQDLSHEFQIELGLVADFPLPGYFGCEGAPD